jgi:hypothetical protein
MPSSTLARSISPTLESDMGIWEISTALNPRSLSRFRVANAPSNANSFLSIIAWTPILVIPTPSSPWCRDRADTHNSRREPE